MPPPVPGSAAYWAVGFSLRSTVAACPATTGAATAFPTPTPVRAPAANPRNTRDTVSQLARLGRCRSATL